MKVSRYAKRRAAAIQSLKILLTAGALSATVGGWAVFSAAANAALPGAQVVAAAADSTGRAAGSFARRGALDTGEDQATATPAPTAAPTRPRPQPRVRTQSSR